MSSVIQTGDSSGVGTKDDGWGGIYKALQLMQQAYGYASDFSKFMGAQAPTAKFGTPMTAPDGMFPTQNIASNAVDRKLLKVQGVG